MTTISIIYTANRINVYQHDAGSRTLNTLNNQANEKVSKSSGVTVNISSTAKQLFAKDNSELGKKIAQQYNEKAKQTTDEIDAASKTNHLDRMIEQIQQQIKTIQKRLRALNSDKSEAAENEKKLLASQLIALNGSLMALIGKKMEAVKA